MSPDELESWEETLALDADPGALARIARGEAEIVAGQYMDHLVVASAGEGCRRCARPSRPGLSGC